MPQESKRYLGHLATLAAGLATPVLASGTAASGTTVSESARASMGQVLAVLS
ncbi:hypothetical protein ACOBQX_00925 [Actinokineospora sp. G85]|uniref:hypothetical protein n=1 Tax=Actinokineospora sp. G85 TaxID=3406626 RepID=UPI003C753DAD